MDKIIILGGGLSGLSAAHTVLEHGGRVLVIDKNSFLGGNSTKATSGINGAGTATQRAKKIPDTAEQFYEDTAKSARSLLRPELVRTLAFGSGPAVEWLQTRFNLDLSLVSPLGGHTFPRTHRGKERFPGMTITYGLMEKFEEICSKEPQRAKLVTKARATRLLQDASGAVTGVEYVVGGQKHTAHGPVIIATGGYGADFESDSLLVKHRPDLLAKGLATTNGDHCTGDGIKMSLAIGAGFVDPDKVQVHPTGLVDPKEPDAKVKFLAAEALRGCGALLLDGNGRRFCNELGHRDYVSGRMFDNKGPFRLVLNGAASKEIEWHVKHYIGRGLMLHFSSGAELAKAMGIPAAQLEETFKGYNDAAKNDKCPFGRKLFFNSPFDFKDEFNVAIVTPVVHYTMGGVQINGDSEVCRTDGSKIEGLWCCGEAAGGVHGENRLGGSSLLDCVVYGRVAGNGAARYLLSNCLANPSSAGGSSTGGVRITIEVQGNSASVSSSSASAPASAPATGSAPASAAPAKSAEVPKKMFTREEVAKHNKDDDCWVIINNQVLDVTKFLSEHPGGKKAILLFKGKDASEEFNMLHKPDVIAKYAPETVLGVVDDGSSKKSKL